MSTNLKNPNQSETDLKKDDEYTYRPRARAQSTSKTQKTKNTENKSFNKLFVIIPIAVIVAVLLGVVAYSMTLPKNKIADNVYIGSIDVGGMAYEDAFEAINNMITEDTTLSVVSGTENAEFLAADFELSVDAEETINSAMAVGKTNNPILNAYHAVKLLFTQHISPVKVTYNTEKLDNLLFDFGTTINGVSTEHTFEYTDTSMTIIPGTPGQNHDTSVARNQVIGAVALGQFDEISVTLDYAEPTKLDSNKIYTEITQPVQNAEYIKSEETGEITVKAHTVGVEVEKSVLKSAIDKVNNGESVTIPAAVTLPERTKDVLEANLFSATLATYSTDFSSSSSNRAYNVQRAASSVNGTILMPGEEFSYNGTVGNPSLKNGYKVAPIFENGKTSQGVGGGICQVSSTLYNTVLYSDLAVTERHNHSLTVAYVPKGQDATVSYGTLDFKFKNSTDYPIKINATSANRKLTISILGGEDAANKTVTISNTIVSTIAPGENVTEDPTLAPGTRNVTSKGKNGYIVDTYKTVYENGVKVSSKKITTSRYRATNAEVIAGPALDVPPIVDPSVNNGEIVPGDIISDPSASPETTEPPVTDENPAENPVESPIERPEINEDVTTSDDITPGITPGASLGNSEIE